MPFWQSANQSHLSEDAPVTRVTGRLSDVQVTEVGPLLGASNALRVYNAWGRPQYGRPALTDRSLRLLAYMALVSVDGDAEPWCGVGHRQLAILALGLDIPEDPVKADAALRKVRRAIAPLHKAGAIRTVRRATYGIRGEIPARYRIYLDGPEPGGRTSPENG